MRIRFLQAIWFTVLVIATTPPLAARQAPAQGPPAPLRTPAQMDDAVVAREAAAIVKAWDDLGWFSGAVLVAKGDRVLYRGAAGVASADHPIRLTPDMPMRIVQLSQLMTLAAVYKLQESGKLTMTEPVGTYVPTWPELYRALTLEQLLSGATGVTDTPQIEEFMRAIAEPRSVSELASVIVRMPFIPGPPAPTRANNSVYHLAAAVVEKVSGMPFEDYVAKAVLVPAGLTHTHRDAQTRAIPGRAQPLVRTPTGFAPASWFNMDNAAGKADMLSTVDDYFRFLRALIGGKVISPASFADMMRFRVPARAAGAATIPGSALGLTIATTPVTTWLSAGFITGAYASMTYYPDSEVLVLVISNVGGGNEPNAVSQSIVNAIYGRTVYKPSRHTGRPPTAAEAAALLGSWELQNAFVLSGGTRQPALLTARFENGRLLVNPAVGRETEWHIEAPGRFFEPYSDQQITIAPGQTDQARFLNFGLSQTLTKKAGG